MGGEREVRSGPAGSAGGAGLRTLLRPARPPPRPPRLHTPLPASTRRDIDAIKESLRLPQSVSAKLASRTPTEEDKPVEATPPPRPESREERRSQESAYSDDFDQEYVFFVCSSQRVAFIPRSPPSPCLCRPSIKLVSAPPVHKREGAFPPSKILSSPPGRQYVQSPQSSQPPSSFDEESHADMPPRIRMGDRPVVVVEHDEPILLQLPLLTWGERRGCRCRLRALRRWLLRVVVRRRPFLRHGGCGRRRCGWPRLLLPRRTG